MVHESDILNGCCGYTNDDNKVVFKGACKLLSFLFVDCGLCPQSQQTDDADSVVASPFVCMSTAESPSDERSQPPSQNLRHCPMPLETRIAIASAIKAHVLNVRQSWQFDRPIDVAVAPQCDGSADGTAKRRMEPRDDLPPKIRELVQSGAYKRSRGRGGHDTAPRAHRKPPPLTGHGIVAEFRHRQAPLILETRFIPTWPCNSAFSGARPYAGFGGLQLVHGIDRASGSSCIHEAAVKRATWRPAPRPPQHAATLASHSPRVRRGPTPTLASQAPKQQKTPPSLERDSHGDSKLDDSKLGPAQSASRPATSRPAISRPANSRPATATSRPATSRPATTQTQRPHGCNGVVARVPEVSTMGGQSVTPPEGTHETTARQVTGTGRVALAPAGVSCARGSLDYTQASTEQVRAACPTRALNARPTTSTSTEQARVSNASQSTCVSTERVKTCPTRASNASHSAPSGGSTKDSRTFITALSCERSSNDSPPAPPERVVPLEHASVDTDRLDHTRFDLTRRLDHPRTPAARQARLALITAVRELRPQLRGPRPSWNSWVERAQAKADAGGGSWRLGRAPPKVRSHAPTLVIEAKVERAVDEFDKEHGRLTRGAVSMRSALEQDVTHMAKHEGMRHQLVNVRRQRLVVPEKALEKVVYAVVPEKKAHVIVMKQWGLWDSIWVPRVKWADSKDFFDTTARNRAAFELDWGRAATRFACTFDGSATEHVPYHEPTMNQIIYTSTVTTRTPHPPHTTLTRGLAKFILNHDDGESEDEDEGDDGDEGGVSRDASWVPSWGSDEVTYMSHDMSLLLEAVPLELYLKLNSGGKGARSCLLNSTRTLLELRGLCVLVECGAATKAHIYTMPPHTCHT